MTVKFVVAGAAVISAMSSLCPAARAQESFEVAKWNQPAPVVVGAGLSHPAEGLWRSEPEPSRSEGWRFEITPYLFLPALDGKSTVDGRTVDVDLDFSEIFDELFEWGVSGRIEAWHGDWGFILDAQYVDLGSEFSTPGPAADIDVDLDDATVDVLVAYRFYPLGSVDESGAADSSPDISVDLMAGGRYHYLKQRVDLGPFRLGESYDWVEPVVGARAILPFELDGLSMIVRGDIGGFGVGSASDFTWNALAGLDYRFCELLSGKLGYRVMSIDYDRGSGNNRFALDATFSGPFLGFTFHF